MRVNAKSNRSFFEASRPNHTLLYVYQFSTFVLWLVLPPVPHKIIRESRSMYHKTGIETIFKIMYATIYRVGLMLPYTYTPYSIDIMSKIWCVGVRQHMAHTVF